MRQLISGDDAISPPRILITGSSGFIGGHLFQRFQGLGWDTVGLGRRALALPGYVAHDLARPLPFTEPFDVVIHAAARSSPWGSRAEFERDNVQATQNVIDFCERNGSPRLLFISSSSVYYRDCHQLNITEETPLAEQPVNAYAATKQRAEQRVRAYRGPWAILRPRAVVGPGDTVLLPRILRAARAGRLPLLTCPDGPVIGDLIYLDNLGDFIIRAATDSSIQGDYNLTNNEPVPILEFLVELFRRLDYPIPTRRVSVTRALWLAWALEWAYTLLPLGSEPPITRFGVHVFAYSKTFDVSKMLADMGAPRVSLREGLEAIVADLKSQDSTRSSP
jgi:nucleoside-diphosphate-sugar epimerase